jgi:hypothetical protein
MFFSRSAPISNSFIVCPMSRAFDIARLRKGINLVAIAHEAIRSGQGLRRHIWTAGLLLLSLNLQGAVLAAPLNPPTWPVIQLLLDDDTPAGNLAATLTWNVPAAFDGAAVPAGFRIYYGKSSRTYSGNVFVPGTGTLTGVVSGLTPGTWYFAITSIDAAGNESDFSHEITKAL